MYSIVKTSK